MGWGGVGRLVQGRGTLTGTAIPNRQIAKRAVRICLAAPKVENSTAEYAIRIRVSMAHLGCRLKL